MNPIKHIYCRCFQTAFKLAIPFLPYRSPITLHSVSDIPALLKEQNIRRVLVTTDAALRRLGLLNGLEAALAQNGIDYVIYDKTAANPTIDNVEEALELYHRKDCQGLIGFGGGSAMDCAKAVGARVARPRVTIPRMRGILRILKPLPFLIAVPTTAGTGSETTVATVITDSATHHKFPISDFPLIPRAAVHDPTIVKDLPPAVTASTGMDALTHAVEAYIGRSTVPATRRDALEAASLVAGNLKRCYDNGSDLEARANMLRAAFLAGRAFSKSYVGYCHAVAHSLGGRYNTPHGLANAVLLPYVLEAYGSSVYGKLKDMAVAVGIAQEETPAAEAALRFIQWIKDMNASMNIPSKLPGIQEEDIPRLASYAEKEANPVYPVPVLMTARELEQFYYDVME